MHDGAEVVGAQVVAVLYVLVEVVLHRRVDVGPVDLHELVAVLAALLMPQAHGVADLVDGVAGGAARAQRDGLHAAAPPHMRGAAAAGHEAHIVRVLRGVGRRAQHEADHGVGLPMRNGIGDARLVGQRRVHLIGHAAAGPAELHAVRAGDAHREQHRVAGFVGLHVGHAAKHDVALEDGLAIDIGIVQPLARGPMQPPEAHEGRARQRAGAAFRNEPYTT